MGKTSGEVAMFDDGADPELANRLMWRGQPGHYEVWYLTASHRESGSGFWIRYTLESPTAGHGPPYVQLWFCRGSAQAPEKTFGINRKFPLEALAHTTKPFSVRIGDAGFLGHNEARGSLTGRGHRVSWDLKWQPAPSTHLFLPRALYSEPFGIAETLVLSPNLSVYATGTIEVDGELLELRSAPLGQTHLWGRRHAYGWAWAHCNSFDLESGTQLEQPSRTVFEALTVRMRRGPVVVPLTLLSVYPDGLDGEALRFTEWHTLPLCRSDYRTGHYTLTATGPLCKIEATFTSRPTEMVQSEYLDPDGTPAYCHFTPAGACELSIYKRAFPGAPLRLLRRLGTQNGAQFEWGGRAGDSLVRTRHQLVEE